jgi:3'-phosphoadenosine 5'-phosphosulfate sulfotransferase (PAPS reductase)/FAD synthetase
MTDTQNAESDFPKKTGRVLARFSCGAASAVATKLAIKKYGDAVEIYYNDTGSEHPDNTRFLQSCEVWFQRKINILRSDKYENIWDVFEKRKFLSSPAGAPCTSELKRIPGEAVWTLGDVEIFGYTADEMHRVDRFRANNNERIIECPLIDQNLTKEDCLGMLDREGIRLPTMYSLGFRNNNCIGCVKAQSIDYWKRVRKHFPDHFKRMAKIERELGHAINRVTQKGERIKVFLDEIEDGDPKGADPNIQCGLFCMSVHDQM